MADSINNQQINNTAYSNIKKDTVYASADTTPDSKIVASEAANRKPSIFEPSSQEQNALNDVINSSTRLADDKKEAAKSLIQKYLGGVSLGGFLNNWAGFSTINYTAVEINDSENAAEVRAQIDTQVDKAIEQGLKNVGTSALNNYKAAIDKALSQVENELVGDADIINNDGTVKGKDENFDLSKLEYKRSSEDGENTNVATFNSNTKGADVTQGYSNTIQYLEANGAKAKEKTVNGVKQMVYEVKVDGQKQYVVVDDAGQVHNLDRDKGFLRSSKFTTEDSIEDAKYQANNDNTTFNDIESGTEVKVKVRKVDGQDQSVMTWKDKDGNKHSRVIDHNDVTGLTTSADLHQVNAGGRAKYASDTSGLGALAHKDINDQIYFDDSNHKLHTDTWTDKDGNVHESYAGTESKRMKLDANNIEAAVSNITQFVINHGGKVVENTNDSTKVNINGHTYTIDKTDNKSADKTMRLIQGEIDRMQRNNDSTPGITPSEITLSRFNIVEDNRIDANIKRDGSTIKYPDGEDYTTPEEDWKSGGIVEGAGVDASHQTSQNGQGKVNTVKYDSSLTREQFISEGWITDANREKENEYLKLMDSPAIKGNSKSVRNLANSIDFAERFIAAYKQQNNDDSNYNAVVLSAAITAANPSLFDGTMYKNADFSRLNLPKNIDRFKVDSQEVKEDDAPAPVVVKPEPPVTPVVTGPADDPEYDKQVRGTSPVSPTPKPAPISTKPVIQDRGLSDEEIEQYIQADDNYQAKLADVNNIDKAMREIETKYNFTRGDNLSEERANLDAGIANKDFKNYSEMKFFMGVYGNKFEESFKNTLKNWVDTSKDEDVSKSVFNRKYNNRILVDVTGLRKETLPDGTKVYNTKQGYYDLFFDGKPGKKMTEEELIKHGWRKPE